MVYGDTNEETTFGTTHGKESGDYTGCSLGMGSTNTTPQ